ncbi:hypothetical protein ACI6QG_18850 [Roseococcus sp. DSY-14]|uniref:hypothetical protein n=1 Tax=Roseococcus sp. DSY-14 TaxID=3369650 RepID=UPI00387AE6CF
MDMPTDTGTTSAEAIREGTKNFVNLGWVGAMHSYAYTVSGINAPAAPPDQEKMVTVNRHGVPILSVAQLMERTKTNAFRWKPLLDDMLDVARPIKEYASLAMITIEQIAEQSKEKLAPAAWAKLTPAERAEVRAVFEEMIGDLKEAAERNHEHANAKRAQILAYQADIVADREETVDIQAKYKDWLAAEDATMQVWEKEHGLQPGEVDGLIKGLQKEVEEFNAKWAGLTSGAVVSAGTSPLGMMVFPPLGAIACLIAMSVMASQAAAFKQQVDEFQGRLARVQRFNAVRIFFSTMDTMFGRMIETMGGAAKALEEIAGLWAMIATDLKSILGATIGLDGLAGAHPWEAPVKITKKLGVLRAYKALIHDCDVFISGAYVTGTTIIHAGKQP